MEGGGGVPRAGGGLGVGPGASGWERRVERGSMEAAMATWEVHRGWHVQEQNVQEQNVQEQDRLLLVSHRAAQSFADAGQAAAWLLSLPQAHRPLPCTPAPLPLLHAPSLQAGPSRCSR